MPLGNGFLINAEVGDRVVGASTQPASDRPLLDSPGLIPGQPSRPQKRRSSIRRWPSSWVLVNRVQSRAWLGSSFRGPEHSARAISYPHDFLKSPLFYE